MNRRQDAARIMNKYQGERLQGKPMTVIIGINRIVVKYGVTIIMNVIDYQRFLFK